MRRLYTLIASLFSMDRQKMRFLLLFMLGVFLLIVLNSAMFLGLMRLEGREYSLISALYWTISTMSTLGFGDITFNSDLGRLFSILVLFSGIVVFVLTLPLVFLRLIYQPWVEAHKQLIVPRELPPSTSGHVLIVGCDEIALNTLERMRRYNMPCHILVQDHPLAVSLFEQGLPVLLGEPDSAATYLNARIERAAMVVALQDNLKNTNIAATVRDIAPHVTIAASASHDNAEDILHLAGCNYVFNFTNMLGSSMGSRVFTGKALSGVIVSFQELHIAEALASGEYLTGKNLRELNLRANLGVNVIGVRRGPEFFFARPDARIEEGDMLLLSGSRANLKKYSEFACQDVEDQELPPEHPVLILGGGKVGTAVAQKLSRRNIKFTMLDKRLEAVPSGDNRFVLGDAEDINALRNAGIDNAHSIVITTHNDDLNIYLTLYCRKLRPEVQIITRCNLTRNKKSMYNAGANLVMTVSGLSANSILNILSPGTIFSLTEGLNIFRVNLPRSLLGKTLCNGEIRERTQCNVVAVVRGGEMKINQDPKDPFQEDDELVMIGALEAEQDFLRQFPPDNS
jgi:Trk K+ transport system NAD-binding subunit